MTTLDSYLKSLNGKNIHIVGASGTEGSEIAVFLDIHKIKNVTLHDFSQTEDQYLESFQKAHKNFPLKTHAEKLEFFKKLKYPLNLNPNYLKDITEADIIFVPQSWYLYPANKSLIDLKNSIHFSSLTRLYLELLPCKIIGITGSNGKSTTTFLTYHLLSQNPELKTYLTGNDRRATQLLNIIDQIQPEDIVVTEISNRQLTETDNLAPDIAVITNITENHLAEHASLEEYANIKAKIFQFQNNTQHYLINAKDLISSSLKIKSQGEVHYFNSEDSKEAYFDDNYLYLNQNPLIEISKILLKGPHNLENACAAILAAHLAGLSPKFISQGLENFKGLPERQELICEVNNIKYYNDRQGTAVDATIKAIQATSGNKTLIFGGINKGMSIDNLAQTINQNSVIAVGIKSPFCTELAPHLNNYHQVETLTDAVNLASKITLKPGSVIFSPGCEYGPHFNPLPGHEDAENFTKIALNLT